MSNSLGVLLRRLADDPVTFNRLVLGRVHETLPDGYWSRQQEVCRAFYRHKQVNCPSGHGTGKTFLASGLGIHYLLTRPNSVVICYAPSTQQMLNGLWPEIKKAYTGARIELPGRVINGSNPKIELGPKWYLQCRSADTDPERLQGVHAGRFAVICDESSWSGYDQALEAIESQNPERLLLLGNPIQLGKFSSYCDRADGVTSAVIPINSLESPHIDLDRSPVGLADKGWLDSVRLNYGEDSLYWRVRVLGQWPDEDSQTLVPNAWLDRCVATYRSRGIVRKGPIRIGIDIAEGSGGDQSVICVRDDDNLLELVGSNRWDFGTLATQVAEMVERYKPVMPGHIVFDAGGPGADFANRLAAVGITGARAYKGGMGGAKNAVGTNLRSCAYWACRRRLDPDRVLPVTTTTADWHPLYGTPTTATDPQQPPFAISPQHMELLRPMLSGLTYAINGRGKLQVQPKDEVKKRLGRSPDAADAFGALTFSF